MRNSTWALCCLFCLATLVWSTTFVGNAIAQSNPIDYLKRMDDNRNGLIEPREISDRARPFLERIAGETGIDLDRTNSIRRWEYAAKKFQQSRDSRGAATDQIDKLPTISGFGIEPDAELLPGFGAPIKYRYNLQDLEEADRLLRRYDRNKDGSIDLNEAKDESWSRGNPFEFDLNQDARVSRLELAQRYAERRVAEVVDNQPRFSVLSKLTEPLDDGRSGETSDRDRGDRREWDRSGRDRGGRERRDRGSNSGSRSLASSILSRFDRNRDRQLDISERTGLGIDDGQADLDFDGNISFDELDNYYFQQMQTRVNDLSGVLPTWFFERDANGDNQIDMSEFTDEWDEEKIAEFESFDPDHDGILTTAEMLRSQAIVGGSFASQKAEMLLPNSTAVSEIDVTDDFFIGDLNVRLSITHSYNEQLDGYLIGPDGQRIELFSAVGRSDDNFDDTIFDDQASEPIRRAQAPFRGSFQPQAVEKRQESLSRYNGKNLKGTWQLMLRCNRSDRFGVLHGWALEVKPLDEFAERPKAEENDSAPKDSSPSSVK